MAFGRFEAWAQRLVEESFHRIWGRDLQPLDVARQLADQVTQDLANGTVVTAYAIQLQPAAYGELLNFHPQFVPEMETFAQKLAQQARLPHLRLDIQPDNNVPNGTVRIVPANGSATPTQIQEPAAASDGAALRPLLARRAFLVVNGRQHIPLNKPILTIGRRADCDIVLAASSVSRQHAQIRWRHGRFVLFDISSRGRTAVNGIRKQEHILHSGDVIQLSQESLIYAEDWGDDDPGADEPTQPYTPINRQ